MSQLPVKTFIKRHDKHSLHGGGKVFSPLIEPCCGPATLALPPAKVESLPVRRSKLADLDPNIHCSIIGTCLTTSELRKLVPRYAATLDRQRSSDLQIHHAAVELSTCGGVAAKQLHKALDTRHELAIRRFKAAGDADTVRALWADALASGDIPGAYWALLTHPCTTLEVQQVAFGDVHMLSHLVGASNRADIRRLVALEAECGALKEQNEHQQARLHEVNTQHELAIRQLQQQVLQLTAQREPAPRQMIDDMAELRRTLEDREQKLALFTARRNEAEQRLLEHDASRQGLQASVQRLEDELKTAHAETLAVEQAWSESLADDADNRSLQLLDGKCVVYVGGRPGSAAMLSRLVAAAGGQLLVHDGGIEDRRGLLDAMLPGADLVVFPVDCISHNAMQIVKRACERHAIAYHPVRSASTASFVELIERLTAAEYARQAKPASRFCLRHG
ncbi:DUF2325 domain-containing protein [Janthinobacterium agaricidamnosum]|uniref:Uncharacterized protein n=1 Tax=Janthinobacterium agaricidamnosum NBRC 102515 = DSM 9628 TaxID=1349767 RepID=W0V7A8_9BURK|nr:DUF2325 domain-containing protein [Janthinobacterium agaricidamnosum]CDG83455.1 putative uncharacterized protein [Janthinobacterium agaricidamnosum NBRC 102515 = DSM 9628]